MPSPKHDNQFYNLSMTEQQSSNPNSIQVAQPPKIFYTDVNEKGEMEKQEGKLKKYVDNLNKKIDYAKWKQSLVLQYNYLPMKRVTDKVENERINYIRKIADEEKNYAKLLSGKEITVQLDLFRDFSKKLNEKLQEYQVKIAQEKMNNNMMNEEVQSKRMRLKQMMRENMDFIRSTLENNGVRNKEDIITLVRSKSTRDRFNPSSLTFDSHRQYTDRKVSNRKLSSQHTKRQPLNLNDQFFRQSLQKLVGSIQSMKSSEDIQSGIYLDVMGKSDKHAYTTQGRYSKSKISETLHSRFGSSHIQQVKNSRNKTNFQMEWQTFKQLNWKQIMGIVLVKDKNCAKLKNLLRCK